MTTIKSVREKKKLKGLIGFLSANKIDSCNKRGEKKKKKNPKESAEQVKK